MKKVKVTWPPEVWDIAKYSPNGDCIWGDYEFFLNKDIDNPDYWIVCGNTCFEVESAFLKKNNVLLVGQENKDVFVYPENFLEQFEYVFSFRDDIKHTKFIETVPVLPWFVKGGFKHIDGLNKIEKTKKISLLTSNKKPTKGHIKRFNFVNKIHRYFGNEIDIFSDGFTGYVYDKTPTLDPYMFTFALESFSVPYYFSEKLADSYLSLCYPIYYGCSNLNKYFNENSFSLIDINNVDQSIKVIQNILDDDNFYDDRLKYIVEAKNKYLHEYSLFAVLAKILNEVEMRNMNLPDKPKEKVVINKFIPKKDLPYILKRGNLFLYDKFSTLINH